MKTMTTYCRNCASNCGLLLDVAGDRIVSIRTDRDNPISQGYACVKGMMAAHLHNGEENRLLQCMKRGDDGIFRSIDKYQAVAEIAERLQAILARHGPRALAAFFGTTSYSDCVGKPFLKSLMAQLGSPAIFSSMTVDQSSKWVTAARMGIWANGKPVYTETDVILIAGCNPPVSHQGYPMNPYPATNVTGHLRAAKIRGVRLIVIDPRRTELARQADLYLQPLPGHDAEIFAGLIRLVLDRGWGDMAFCARYTVNLQRLRRAVEPFTAEAVASSAGIDAADLQTAAQWIGEAKKPGLGTGTGVDMAAFSNTTEHLVEALTGLVGGYVRAGERIPNPGVFMPRPDFELVIPPNRTWEHDPKCASDSAYGKLMGEFPASIFPDEVMHGGSSSIRAMFVTGANPAMCLGDPQRVDAALEQLELLVTFDPRLESATARKSHYVIAPTLQFERSEVTTFTEAVFHEPFIQYTAAAKIPPPQTMGEQEFFWHLARHLGVALKLKNLPFGAEYEAVTQGLEIDMEIEPGRDELIAWLVAQTAVSFEDLKAHPHGMRLDVHKVLRPPPADDGSRLDLCPPDVAEEIAQVAQRMQLTEPQWTRPYLLIVRRINESFNSSFHDHDVTRRMHGTNRLYVHPLDMTELQVVDDDAVRIESAHGEVVGYVRSDASMGRGVVSMTHCWGAGSAPDPWALRGAHTGRLVSMRHDLQSINRMPKQSGIAVALEKLSYDLKFARAQAGRPGCSSISAS